MEYEFWQPGAKQNPEAFMKKPPRFEAPKRRAIYSS
jgi:hypothetical protein